LGDGGPATQAQLSITQGCIVVSPDGTIFFADDQHHRIRKAALNGMISTVAGTGAAGYNGDGIAATQAQLNTPLGLALAPDGSLFISEFLNYRVRKVAPNGIITTVAGNGTQGYSGDGGPATQARFDHPHGIALAPDGSLYVADEGNVAVRRIAPDGIITIRMLRSADRSIRTDLIRRSKPGYACAESYNWVGATSSVV
jgi:sugar lactone lactonase YvrE